MRSFCLTALWLLAVSGPGLLVSDSAAATFHVSPRTGSDSNPGTQARPFATIQRAQRAVRGITRHASGDIVVWLHEGLYRLPQPLMFRPEDSGRNGFYVRYKAYPNEKPMLSNGIRITGWQVTGDPVEKMYVASARGQRFRQLYVGDTRGIRARYPDLSASPNFLESTSIFAGADGYLRIDIDRSLVDTGLQATLASTSYRQDVEIVMYYPYSMSRLRILRGAAVAGTNLYRLVVAAPDGQLEIKKGTLPHEGTYTPQHQRCYLENYRGFLSHPNEWYLDPVSDLVYFRAPDHVTSVAGVEALGIVVPMGTAEGDNETLISIQGRLATAEPVRNLTFERLIFAHTNWLGPSSSGFVGTRIFKRYLPSPSDANGVARDTPPAAIEINHTENIEFTGNVFQNFGASGIRVEGIAKDFRAIGNAFFDVNGNAIEAEGHHALAPKDRFRIESNRFSFIGWDYQSVAILASRISDVKIRHNEIDFTTDAGIVTRGGGSRTGDGCYGDGPLSGVTGNEISANIINRPTRRIIDMGAIYNPCKQTLAITYNRITNISPPAWYSNLSWYSLGGIGVYLDYASSGVTIHGNTIENVPHPFKLNCESNSVITNNRTDLAPGTESAATPRACVAQSQVYGPSTTLVSDSNSSTVPLIPEGMMIGMNPSDVSFLSWLRANINRDFPFDAPRSHRQRLPP